MEKVLGQLNLTVWKPQDMPSSHARKNGHAFFFKSRTRDRFSTWLDHQKFTNVLEAAGIDTSIRKLAHLVWSQMISWMLERNLQKLSWKNLVKRNILVQELINFKPMLHQFSPSIYFWYFCNKKTSHNQKPQRTSSSSSFFIEVHSYLTFWMLILVDFWMWKSWSLD